MPPATITKDAKNGRGDSNLDIPYDKRLTLTWDDVCVSVRKPRNIFTRGRQEEDVPILKNVSGYAGPGTLTALMGCSGAGKTTLLNVLARRNLRSFLVMGSICVNGVPVENLESLSKIVGYVQQTNILPDCLTVEEQLRMTAILCLDKKLSHEEKMSRVKEVMTEMGLHKCADVLIGSHMTGERISGGERKRLSIACRLLSNPRVLLLDEPTTGLDAFACRMIILHLTKLSSYGYTVLCTIHQPSSEVFRMFDRLVLLAEGHCAFHGSREHALQYFSSQGHVCPDNYNPSDFYTSLLIVRPWKEAESNMRIHQICNTYKQSREERKVHKEIQRQYRWSHSMPHQATDLRSEAKRSYKTSWPIQFCQLMKRNTLRIYRLPQRSKVMVFRAILNVIMMSFVFYNQDRLIDQSTVYNMVGLLFFYEMQFTISSGSPIVATASDAFPLFKEDYKNSLYTPSAFYWSILASELLLSLISIVLSYLVSYYFAGLYRSAEVVILSFLFFYGSCVVCSAYYALFGYAFENKKIGTILAQSLQPVLVLLGGFYINLRTLPWYVQPLHYLDWVPWTVEAVNVLQWRHVEHIGIRAADRVLRTKGHTYFGCENEDELTCVHSGQDLLDQRGFKESNLRVAVYFLIGQTIFYQTLALSILIRRARRILD